MKDRSQHVTAKANVAPRPLPQPWRVTDFVPWLVAAGGALMMLVAAVPRGEADGVMHLEEFGRLPVVSGGRVQPIDTFARTTLMAISSRQSAKKDQASEAEPAVKFLLEVMTSNRLFGQRAGNPQELQVFRIDNLEVLDLLGLKARPGWYRYSINDFAGKMDRLAAAASRAQAKDAKKRSLFEVKVLHLEEQLGLYHNIVQWGAPFVVPPAGATDDWMTLGQAFVAKGPPPALADAKTFAQILVAYADQDVAEFNKAVAKYRERIDGKLPAESSKAGLEHFFLNSFSPLHWCSWLYALVFVLAGLSWLTAPKVLSRSAFWLGVVILVVHTLVLLARMYLSGRWLVFVTNLYSSAVFIGWMCVLAGLILERLYRNGVGTFLGGLSGFACLTLARYLGSEGDTLENLQAVLDTNFWLMTHVTTVTIGYAATILAGLLGWAYISVGVFTPFLQQELRKIFSQMIYGVVCFAMLFSFVGTVLGGIWADQSWGRFWGWDPKENGALLIVLWNALILHARWGGVVKQRGMAVLAVGGNMVTGWSWFGTNQLGVGLHAYGFNNTLAMGLLAWWSLNILFIVIGSLPLICWRSYAAPPPPEALALAPSGVPVALPVKRGGGSTGIKK
jgi:ABC-type transport system involved in cytochrome c biogenesis permease subunit